MKTRDELAEMFAVAALPTGDVEDAAAFMDHMFEIADAFVAERERRAGGAAVDWDSATVRLNREQLDNIAIALRYDGRGLPIGQLVEEIKERSTDRSVASLREQVAALVEQARKPSPPPSPPARQAQVLEEIRGMAHDPDAGCAGCEHYVRETASASARCVAMGKSFGVAHDASRPAAPHCPKRAPAETAAPALRFTASGALLSVDGFRYATRERDGYSADAPKLGDDFTAVVRIAARDRDHAERIVAAMLPVGRETK